MYRGIRNFLRPAGTLISFFPFWRVAVNLGALSTRDEEVSVSHRHRYQVRRVIETTLVLLRRVCETAEALGGQAGLRDMSGTLGQLRAAEQQLTALEGAAANTGADGQHALGEQAAELFDDLRQAVSVLNRDLVPSGESLATIEQWVRFRADCYALGQHLLRQQLRLRVGGPLRLFRLLAPEMAQANAWRLGWYYARRPLRAGRVLRELALALPAWFWLATGLGMFLVAQATMFLVTEYQRGPLVALPVAEGGATAPSDPTTLATELARRGLEMLRENRAADALLAAQQALAHDSTHEQARCLHAMALVDLGLSAEGVAAYRELLRDYPVNITALNNLADILATHPDPALRNGSEAVELASTACLLTGQQNPVYLATLAEAHAEAGNLAEARATAERAIELARQRGQVELVETINNRLLWFEAGLAVRQPSRMATWMFSLPELNLAPPSRRHVLPVPVTVPEQTR